jgi:hypothetical protein
MFKPTRLAAVALCAAMLAAIAASAMAAPAFVTPKRAALKIRDVRCPGKATLQFVVWSDRAGSIRIELERMGRGVLGSDVIRAETRKKGAYKGVYSGTVNLARSNSRATYRIIASGNGRIKRSKWVTLRSCTLVM